MSIPLDRLYHYLDELSSDDILIYRWFPHGSKKIQDLALLYQIDFSDQWQKIMTSLPLICHDQEPLNFSGYDVDECNRLSNWDDPAHKCSNEAREFIEHRKRQMHIFRVRANSMTVYDQLLLCHSEKNSVELKKFEDNGFIGVYYWSHALISRDWFRFAEHDTSLKNLDFNFTNDFLIYNRAWLGTREYRLKFTELILQNKLVANSNIKFNPHDTKVHYTQHKFVNEKFSISNNNLEHAFRLNDSASSYSADYDSNDYNAAGIDVVLETLFDDTRLHLTEKSLRPIACGKPFILVATPGSLEYLRSYGFKTFNGLLDETYDSILDPLDRLNAIVTELRRIADMPQSKKQQLWKDLHEIADYNKKLFFSKEWETMIINELKDNLAAAEKIAQQYCTGALWRSIFTEFQDERGSTPNKQFLDNWLAQRGHGY